MAGYQELRNLIAIHSRRLQKLREIEAIQGIHTDPSILIEIEDIKEKLAQLREELSALEAGQSSPTSAAISYTSETNLDSDVSGQPLAGGFGKIFRDPVWQAVGVIVAVVALAWSIYAYYGAKKPDVSSGAMPTDSNPVVLAPAVTNTFTPTSSPIATETAVPSLTLTLTPTNIPAPSPTLTSTVVPIVTDLMTNSVISTSASVITMTPSALQWMLLPSQSEVFAVNCPPVTHTAQFYQMQSGQSTILANLVDEGHTGAGIRLDFFANPLPNNYSGWELIWANDGIDLTPYKSLEFFVRGLNGGEKFNVWLMTEPKDASFKRYYQSVTTNATWQKTTLPLDMFTGGTLPTEQIDLKHINKIQFIFEWYETPVSSAVLVDDICLSP